MGKIFYLIGKSASGKDSLLRNLLSDEQENIKEIVQYTTRPIRTNETEGVEYHFVTDQIAEDFIAQGKVIEMRTYHTQYGPWRYFMAADGNVDLARENYAAVGTVESYASVKKYYGDAVVPLYIYVEAGERLMRAVAREKESTNPKYAELCRRFLADEKDYSEDALRAAGLLLPDGTVKNQFENNDFATCLKQIKDFIRNEIAKDSACKATGEDAKDSACKTASEDAKDSACKATGEDANNPAR